MVMTWKNILNKLEFRQKIHGEIKYHSIDKMPSIFVCWKRKLSVRCIHRSERSII